MTGFEDRDEEFGLSASEGGVDEEHGQQTRVWLTRAVAESRPRLGFTAEDLVLGGRRKLRRRRVVAGLASTASVAAVAVAATAFAGGGGGSQVAAETGSTPTAVSTSPSTTQSSKPLSDGDRASADEKDAYAVLSTLFGHLDPGGKHLTTQAPLTMTDMGYFCDGKTGLRISYSGMGEWTVDGRPAMPRNNDDTTPMVQVTVMVTAAGHQQNVFGEWAGFQENWGPIGKSTLPDGSQLQTGTADGGHYVQAVRTLTDGRQLVVNAVDGSVHGVGSNKTVRPTDPFPYTAEQLGQIVAGAPMPLPFANGYQPHVECRSPGAP